MKTNLVLFIGLELYHFIICFKVKAKITINTKLVLLYFNEIFYLISFT